MQYLSLILTNACQGTKHIYLTTCHTGKRSMKNRRQKYILYTKKSQQHINIKLLNPLAIEFYFKF
jgi:hypothetical protein